MGERPLFCEPRFDVGSVESKMHGENKVPGRRVVHLGEVYAKAKDCVTRSVAGETIIVPVRGHVGDLDSIFTLNEVASVIWENIDGQRTVRQVAEAVAEEFKVSREEAERDVGEFFMELLEADLIQPVGGSAA